MKTINLFISALCVICVTADIKFEKKTGVVTHILGGNDAEEGQFPYQVSLREGASHEHFCGGAILSNRFIITAAHCTQGWHEIPHYIYAVVGAVKRLEGGLIVKISDIINHPDYSIRRQYNDISLVHTKEEIVFTNIIQPISLPTHNSIEDGCEVLVSGWGSTFSPLYTSDTLLPNVLKYVKTSALNFKGCFERYKHHPMFESVRETNICTLSPINVGACHGDSGGPLVDASNPGNKTLIGLVSWGVPCGKGYPDVYSRMFSYVDWIRSEMKNYSEK